MIVPVVNIKSQYVLLKITSSSNFLSIDQVHLSYEINGTVLLCAIIVTLYACTSASVDLGTEI